MSKFPLHQKLWAFKDPDFSPLHTNCSTMHWFFCRWFFSSIINKELKYCFAPGTKSKGQRSTNHFPLAMDHCPIACARSLFYFQFFCFSENVERNKFFADEKIKTILTGYLCQHDKKKESFDLLPQHKDYDMN